MYVYSLIEGGLRQESQSKALNSLTRCAIAGRGRASTPNAPPPYADATDSYTVVDTLNNNESFVYHFTSLSTSGALGPCFVAFVGSFKYLLISSITNHVLIVNYLLKIIVSFIIIQLTEFFC